MIEKTNRWFFKSSSVSLPVFFSVHSLCYMVPCSIDIFCHLPNHQWILTLLQFNCFLLMPVVDKLPALLREDLETAFKDDLDNVFDITNLRISLGHQKRNTEVELKRVKHTIFFLFLTLSFLSFSLLTFSRMRFHHLFDPIMVCLMCRYNGLRRNSDRSMDNLSSISSNPTH